MRSTTLFLVPLLAGSLLAASPSHGQSPSAGGAPTSGDFGAERRWVMEHPEAIKALGDMPKEDLGKFLETYRSLPPEEQAQIREHASDLQGLGANERKWALENPDAVRQLGSMSDADRQKLLQTYKSLTPAEQEKLRANADQLKKMTPEEQKWALENPDAVRQLGAMPDGQRDQMLDIYRSLPADQQGMVRDKMRTR
jgi:hypothetical protein